MYTTCAGYNVRRYIQYAVYNLCAHTQYTQYITQHISRITQYISRITQCIHTYNNTLRSAVRLIELS